MESAGATITTKTAAERYEELRVELGKIKKAMQEATAEMLKEGAAGIFFKYPTLHAFSWKQFTPHWCDGETCYFGVRADKENLMIAFVDAPNEMLCWDDFYDEDGENTDEAAENRAILEAIETFMEGFSEDDLEEMFEDHAEVVVSRDGIVVDSYSDHY